MDWFKGKMGQIIALVSIVGTLAGFGYTGATYVNRLENLESKMAKYVDEADSLADQMTDLDKQVVAVGEQIKSLNIDTEDLAPIKNDIVALQTSIAGIDLVALQTSIAAINASIDSMYDDVKSLKNKSDNPLAQ